MSAPLRAVTVGLLAVLLLGSALLQNAASAALGASVDPASRGIYDILVTADDGGNAPALLAPNSLYSGEELLTLDDVQSIRRLAGVEVAAPIAQIVLPGRGYRQAQIRIPVVQDQPVSAPESFRATVRLIGDDGLGERLLSETAYALTIDRANLPAVEGPATASECGFADVMIPCALFPGNNPLVEQVAVWLEAIGGDSSSYSGWNDGQNIQVPVAGSLSVDQRMTLVDPIAERQLLGAAGEFLEPLIALSGERPTDFDAIERWASDRDTAEARQIITMLQDQRDSEAAFRAGPAYAEYLRIKAERNEEPDANLFGGQIGPMVPILLSEAADLRPLRAELSVESFGAIPDFHRPEPGDASYVQPPPVPDAIRNGEPGVALPPVGVDASALLDSRFNGAVAIPWPGSTVDAAATPTSYPFSLDLSSSVSVHDAAPTDIVVTADGRHLVRLDGIGFGRLVADGTSSFGFSSTPDTTARQGATDSEALFGAVRKLGRGNTGQGEYAGAIAVGGFGLADEQAITELAAGTPLGAYEPNQATLLANGDGQTAAPGTIVGGFGTLGLAGNRTGAIADIRTSTFAWDNKVDAVRVRVADVDAYDAAGITAVVRTARDIERLGYRAVIVAGSQSEAVSVSVGNFAFGTMDAAEPQRVGELGVIEQRWSVLGPAAGAGLSIAAGTQLLLGTAIAAVLGAFALSELTGVAARRREAEVLRSLGWRRGRIVRWFAADYAVALPLLALAGIAAVLLAAEQALSAAVVAVALLVVATVVISSLSRSTRAPITGTASEAELLNVLEFEHRPEARILGGDPSLDAIDQPVAPARPSKPLRMPRSAVVWGVQRAWRTPAESLPRASAVLAVMAPIAALSAAATEPGGGGLAQLMLAACGVGAGLVLLASARRRSPVAAPASETVLVTSGWLPRDVRLAGWAATLAGPLAAVFLGSYALWFVLGSVGVDGVNTAVSAALVAGLGATALFLLPRRPSAPRAPTPQPTPARKAALSRGIAS